MSRFKDPPLRMRYDIGLKDNEAAILPVCTKRGHQGVPITFQLERFNIIISIIHCGNCIRTMVQQINRCRSKRQLYSLLNKLKEKYKDGNSNA